MFIANICGLEYMYFGLLVVRVQCDSKVIGRRTAVPVVGRLLGLLSIKSAEPGKTVWKIIFSKPKPNPLGSTGGGELGTQ